MQLTPFPFLTLSGDQTVTEIWHQTKGVIRRFAATDHGARPWLPFEFKPKGK